MSQTLTQQKQRKSISAESRLLIDLKEWMKRKDEFSCINAVPLEKNIFEWHCNICPNSGDYKDVVFHLIIRFDKKSYPMVAPQIELCTRISHSNVFGKWICFDMINRGWKCCYSITSILMQLQSFFVFEESNVGRQRLFDRVQFEYEEMPRIRKFVCNKKCGHCWDKPFPVTQSMSGDYYCKNSKKNKVGRRSGGAGPIAVKNNKNSKNSKKNFCFLDTIYPDLEKSIIEFLNIVDLMKLKIVGKRFGYLANNSKIIQKDGIKCWFHRSIILPRRKEMKAEFNETKKQLKERKEMKAEFDETKKQLKIKKQEEQRQRQREQSLLYQRQQKNSKNKSKKSTKNNKNSKKEIKVLFSWSVISNLSHISPLDNVTEILLNSRRRYPYVRVCVEIVSNKNEVLSFDEMYFDGYLNDNFEIYSGKSYPDKSIDGNISINVKKSACGKKYYADFSKRSLCYRFEENDNIIRARIKGRRVDGTTFECCQPSNWIELLNQRNENLKILQIEKEIHAAKEQLRKEDMKIKQQQSQQKRQQYKQQKQQQRQQRQRQRHGQVQRQIALAVEENKQQTLIRCERKREFQAMTLGEEQKEKEKQRQIVEDVYNNENKIDNGLESGSQKLSRHSHSHSHQQQQQQHYFAGPQQVKFLLVPMMQSVDGQQVQQGQLMQSVQQIYQMAPISQIIGNHFVANGVSMMNGNSWNGNNNNNNNSSSVNTASNSVLSSFDNVSNGFYYDDDCGTNSTSYQSVGDSNSNYYETNNNYNLNEYDIRNEDNNKRHEKGQRNYQR